MRFQHLWCFYKRTRIYRIYRITAGTIHHSQWVYDSHYFPLVSGSIIVIREISNTGGVSSQWSFVRFVWFVFKKNSRVFWDFKHPWCFYKRTRISRIYRITISANIRCSMGLRQISWDFKHLWCFWRRTRITRIYRITINDNIRCSAVIREISKHRRCFLSVVIRKIRVIRVQKK